MFVWWIVHCYRVILRLPDCVWCIFIVFLPFSRRMLRAVQWERHLLKLPHSTHKQMMKTGQRALGTTCFSTIQKVNAEAFTRVIFNFPFLSYSFFSLFLTSRLSNNLLFTRSYFTSQAIKEAANHLICLCRFFFICYCCIYYLCYLKYDRNRSIMISVCVFQSQSDQREPLKTEMWVTDSDLFSCLSRFLSW